MSKKTLVLLLCAAMAVFQLTVACGDDDDDDDDEENGGNGTDGGDDGTDDTESESEEEMEDGPDKFKADFETSDDFFTLMSGMVEGKSPHGSVQIWYSKNIESIIEEPSFTVPKGTVSIKPFDKDSDDTLDGYAVMIKMGDDYDPDNNNWHYEMRDADGELMDDPTPGIIEACYNCHAAASAKDYLAGTEMTK